ncbi:MAG: DUF3459 domain-containing protein, partial [Pseudomonadota bacterium]
GMLSGGNFSIEEGGVLRVHWPLGDGSRLHLIANFAATASDLVPVPPGETVYASPRMSKSRAKRRRLPAWFVAFALEPAHR